MLKLLKRLFKKCKVKTYRLSKPRRIRVAKPDIPTTFLLPDAWYKSWNDNLKEDGWTDKELKQGWRWENYNG